jgi:hypothetical protein
MPPFPEKEITSPEQWADVVDWLIDQDLIDREIPYDQAVDEDLLDATSQSGDINLSTARAVSTHQRRVKARPRWAASLQPD